MAEEPKSKPGWGQNYFPKEKFSFTVWGSEKPNFIPLGFGNPKITRSSATHVESLGVTGFIFPTSFRIHAGGWGQ